MPSSSQEPERPRDVLAPLRLMTDGGVLFQVLRERRPVAETHQLPCFLMRTPATRDMLKTAHVEITIRLVRYEPEGFLVMLHFTLFDHPPHIEPVMQRRDLVQIQITPGSPFRVACLLNPFEEEERAMLHALMKSPRLTIEFYATDEAMMYQCTRSYQTPVEQQRAAQSILEYTSFPASVQSNFLAAVERFRREQPLW